MKISERAMNFVFRVYSNPEDIFHALLVGVLLKAYGYNEIEVAAGYLHDIPTKSNYTIDDISRLFGGKVASLVMTALDIDNTLEWKDKKRQILKIINNLPESNMAVIVADYIIDLEELRIKFKKQGYSDFSNIKVDKEDLENFYKSIYKEASKVLSVEFVNRFYDLISAVFDHTYFRNYSNPESLFERSEGYQQQLINLRKVISDNRPYIIEFIGSDKSGKSSVMKTFKDFFETADFRIKVFDNVSKYKYDEVYVRPNSASLVERNLLISSAIKDNLMREIVGDQDIIMVESGLYDALVMLKIFLDRNEITEEDYNNYMNAFIPDLEFIINHVVVCYASKEELLSRMSLDDLNRNNFYSKMAFVDEYNEALNNLDILLNNRTVLDTTKLDSKEATLRLAGTLFPIMTDEYVLKLKKIIDDRG